MFDNEEYDRWLKEAENTLRSAQIDKENSFFNWCCFKCQQAAEFAVKGLLYGFGLTPFGHSITKLIKNLEVQKLNISEISTASKKLDLHYIPSRYPNAHPSGSPFEYHDENIAIEALNLAKSIIQFVKVHKK
jgi:HEPN domain-containing protein